jgi:adenylate cyclase
MFTDMVGSTAMAQADEPASLRLREEQEGLVRPLFAAHQGRVIKSMGDGFLVEFDSALRAVQCAIDIQQHLHERNSQVGTAPIELRIGVHLGDVEQRGSDIFGDAVNIASRIEPLARPRGVCISGEVFSQVRNKIPNKLEKLPTTPLKGVQMPVDIYRVELPWAAREPASGSEEPAGLAVLPFSNISPDPKDEYFADGLTEELITVLSQLRGLRVIARSSVTPYKSTSKGIAQIGSELRVGSVLEGSVRKSGNRLRVAAQLIDVRTEGHVWAQTFDRELDDIFAVQAELATKVAEVLKIKLQASELARLEERPVIRSDSYLAYLKGRAFMRTSISSTPESVAAAKAQFELAVELDGRNAAAYSGLADAHRFGVYASEGERRAASDQVGRQLAARALEIDPNLAEAHASLALIIWDDYEYLAAEREYKIALSLNPSYSFAHCWYGVLLEDEGRADDALHELELAEASDPLGHENLVHLVRLLGWMGRLDEARAKADRLGSIAPDSMAHRLALGWYYRASSDWESFGRVSELLERDDPLPSIKPLHQAMRCAVSGQFAEARSLLQLGETGPVALTDLTFRAMVYAEIGDLDVCFRWINVACESHALSFAVFRLDPRYANVRSDPRFEKVLKRMNLA